MHIVFCLGGLNKGGAERVVCNLANYFSEKKYKVSLVVTHLDSIAYPLNESVTIYVLEKEKKGSFVSRNIKILKKLYHKIKELQPSIIVSFLKEPTGRVLFLKKYTKWVKKVPLLVSVRSDPKTLFCNFFSRISLYFYKFADGFVFQTKEAQEFFSLSIQEKSTIIANPLEESFFNTPMVKKRLNHIVAVGRLVSLKNYPMLIHAFSKFVKKYSAYELHIYGEGEERENLQRMIEMLSLQDKIFLEGNVDNIVEKINHAKLFIHCSKHEGMPNSLMEAMALGLPCIATNSSGGGVLSLIEDGYNGFVIPLDDLEGLVKRMEDICLNENLAQKLSIHAKESMKNFIPEKINSKWESYIKKLIKTKGEL